MEIDQIGAQYAADEEEKIQLQQHTTLHQMVEFDEALLSSYRALTVKICYTKPDSNSFSSSFRLFTATAIVCPTIQYLRSSFQSGISALYVFKLHHPQKDGYTHGMHVRLHGFVPRRLFELFNEEFVRTLTGKKTELKAYVPVYNKSISLFDYLQTLYVLPVNLLINFSHHLDVLAELQKFQRPDNKEATLARQKEQRMTMQIVENMISMPSKFPSSNLSTLLQMDKEQFRQHLRSSSIQEIVDRVTQDAYNLCLQDKRLKRTEVQEFMEPMTRRSMINRCVTQRTTKQIQVLLQQQYDDYFVHPHFYTRLVKSDCSKLRALDGMIFDPTFLFTVMMVSRWFARACFTQDRTVTNNHAHLLLYGSSGTGKSLIISAISSVIPTYKYMVDCHFQNPELLQSSLFTMEELDVSTLPQNKYKQLLDIKQSVKVDFKNLNPENCTEGMPAMISTNDDFFSKLRGTKKYNQQSIEAAIRRLYIIPVKSSAYDKLHGQVQKEHPLYDVLSVHNTKFEEEPNKLQRLFNLIFAFALFQTDIKGFQLEQRIYGYLTKLASDFSYTTFGTFYFANKDKIDSLLRDAEDAMQQPDQTDSGYLIKICTCHGSFQQILSDFLAQVCQRTNVDCQHILKDKHVPWPIKAYHLIGNSQFTIGLMYYLDKPYHYYLNRDVGRFFANDDMVPFVLQNSPTYQELRAQDSSLFDMQSVVGSKRSFQDIDISDLVIQQNQDQIFT